MKTTTLVKRAFTRSIFISTIIGVIFLTAMHTAQAQYLIGDISNFGGKSDDTYGDVIVVLDGIVAVGEAFVNGGDWEGVTGKGQSDAIIVKYDNYGNVAWRNNFGGSDFEGFRSVTAISDGIIAVGYSSPESFGNGDWTGVSGKGYDDATIVKYDNNGNVIWKKNFGGIGSDTYSSIIAVSDGFIAVGSSYIASVGTGDWEGVTGKGELDAIIVKYDNNGNVVWKKNFGGRDHDYYSSVTAVSDGLVAVGYSNADSFDNGDWIGIMGKGAIGAIIVKYDNNGNVLWKKNFGGRDYDYYSSVTAVSDGLVIVGNSSSGSFGNGDWTGVSGKGNYDAIIVKYDNNGNVIWKKNFGGLNYDDYYDITADSDGIVAVGYSKAKSFDTGDWIGITGKGESDAIIVKYDDAGNVVQKSNFGGSYEDKYRGVAATSDGLVAVGTAVTTFGTTGTGDLVGIIGKGGNDAIVAKYVKYKAVTDIINVPTTAIINVPLQLTGTVVPSNASYQNITWSVINPGTAYAMIIDDNEFFALSKGSALIKASIENGAAEGVDYTQNFLITVNDPNSVAEIEASEINIYPNPATNNITITGLSKGDYISISNISGNKVMQTTATNDVEIIDISKLSAGIYFVKAGASVVKLVVN